MGNLGAGDPQNSTAIILTYLKRAQGEFLSQFLKIKIKTMS